MGVMAAGAPHTIIGNPTTTGSPGRCTAPAPVEASSPCTGALGTQYVFILRCSLSASPPSSLLGKKMQTSFCLCGYVRHRTICTAHSAPQINTHWALKCNTLGTRSLQAQTLRQSEQRRASTTSTDASFPECASLHTSILGSD